MAMQKFRAPALPLPGQAYNQTQFFQLVRALQLYFNQLDSLTPIEVDSIKAGLFDGGLFVGDGTGIQFPYIAASDSTDQYAGGNDTPTVVNWNTLEAGSNWILSPPGSALAQYSGIYKITYSLELANNANAIHDVVVWLRVNGVDLANSATKFTLPARKSAGVPTYICAYSEVTFGISAGDTIELYWATDQAATSGGALGVYIHQDPAQTVPYAHPAIPSAVGSIVFLSALPEPSFTGVSAGGLVGSVEVRVG